VRTTSEWIDSPRLSGRGLDRSRKDLALVRDGDGGDPLGRGIDVSRVPHPLTSSRLEFGIGRSDKTIALRHRETLNFRAFSVAWTDPRPSRG